MAKIIFPNMEVLHQLPQNWICFSSFWQLGTQTRFLRSLGPGKIASWMRHCGRGETYLHSLHKHGNTTVTNFTNSSKTSSKQFPKLEMCQVKHTYWLEQINVVGTMCHRCKLKGQSGRGMIPAWSSEQCRCHFGFASSPQHFLGHESMDSFTGDKPTLHLLYITSCFIRACTAVRKGYGHEWNTLKWWADHSTLI